MSFYKLGGVKSISSTGEIETDEKYAMEEIKYGDAYLASSENDWDSEFYLDDEEEI